MNLKIVSACQTLSLFIYAYYNQRACANRNEIDVTNIFEPIPSSNDWASLPPVSATDKQHTSGRLRDIAVTTIWY